jgi:acyl-CoA reductase-like NAD-dependent aldehyde dehydrogenase
LGTVYQASSKEVDEAVKAARSAFVTWSKVDVNARAQILAKVVDLIVSRYGEQGKITPLKELIMTEMGKRLPEADIEVIETSDMIAFFVREALSLRSSPGIIH